MLISMSKSSKSKASRFEVSGPPRNKYLVYLATALAAIGVVLIVIPTILIFMPTFDLTFSNLFRTPHTYIAIGGLIFLTAGFILHRKITPPMEVTETEKLRSRLE